METKFEFDDIVEFLFPEYIGIGTVMRLILKENFINLNYLHLLLNLISKMEDHYYILVVILQRVLIYVQNIAMFTLCGQKQWKI